MHERMCLSFCLPYSLHLQFAFQDETSLYLITVPLHFSPLSHPFLIPFKEFCPGGDLFDLLSEFGPLDEVDGRIYAAEIVLAVSGLHQKGFLHRDIKPGPSCFT